MDIQELLNFERLISEISTCFINIPIAKIDSEIEKGLKLVVEFLKVDRGTIFQFSEDKRKMIRTHFWTRMKKNIPNSYNYETEELPWTTQKILNGESVVFEDIDELPYDASIDTIVLRKYQIESSVMIPLTCEGSVIGSFAVSTIGNKKIWFHQLLDRMKTIAHIFSSALARKLSEESLHKALKEIKKLKQQLEIENVYLRKEIGEEHYFQGIIGESSILKHVLSQVREVARTDATVLILGETGTGKSLLATVLHNMSFRKNHPLVTINCASLPPNLIESELFGHEKGAFTGANNQQIGRFEIAHGSTLCLEEIGEIPYKLQAKLLRVIESGEFERIGSSQTKQVNVRIIATTNRNLQKEVQQGRFRQDLFYRLNVFPITLPPLRERKDDIPILAETFVRFFSQRYRREFIKIKKNVMDSLIQYSWPGNVRELRNVIERAVILSSNATDFANSIISSLRLSDSLEISQNVSQQELLPLHEIEKNYILKILFHTKWRIEGQRGAAKILGLHPSTLRYRMYKLGINK
ncbi:MAG TPA: sigma 54-interacting transcriptional regulator [Acetivibrio sp.]|nr:sigma 54-interacting transcriptional regulator [Acetivibrio sp.]